MIAFYPIYIAKSLELSVQSFNLSIIYNNHALYYLYAQQFYTNDYITSKSFDNQRCFYIILIFLQIPALRSEKRNSLEEYSCEKYV